MVERTGTDERPRPGSSAIRTPASAAVEAPADASTPPMRAPAVTRVAARRARRVGDEVQTTGRTERSTTKRNAAPIPAPRYATFSAIPGCSSACRATPTGVSRESSAAVTVATRAAATPIATPRPSARARNCTLTKPSSRNTSSSSASNVERRASACPSRRIVSAATTTPRRRSAVACTSRLRCTGAPISTRLLVTTGAFGDRRLSSRVNAGRSRVPLRSRTMRIR